MKDEPIDPDECPKLEIINQAMNAVIEHDGDLFNEFERVYEAAASHYDWKEIRSSEDLPEVDGWYVVMYPKRYPKFKAPILALFDPSDLRQREFWLSDERAYIPHPIPEYVQSVQLNVQSEENADGDRPQSMAVGKLRRMMELEDKEREDCFCDPDNIATCKRHVNELLATETARANAAEAELATLLEIVNGMHSATWGEPHGRAKGRYSLLSVDGNSGIWDCKTFTVIAQAKTPYEAVKEYLKGREGE